MAEDTMNFDVLFDGVEEIFNKDDWEDLNIPTQALFFKREETSTSRFTKPVSDAELTKRISNRVPRKTQQANSWSMGLYKEWAEYRNVQIETILSGKCVPLDITTATLEDLDYWLSRFVMEIRRKDGTVYPPGTLTNIMSAIQRNLRENGRNVNIFKKDDPGFMNLRKSMDSRMKELAAKGVGSDIKRADPISLEDEDKLWNSVFSKMTSSAMSYAVFFYNCKLFGFRGMDEHRNLQVDQFKIGTDEVGKYLSFTGRVCKNIQGGLDHRKIAPKLIKQYAQPDNPRCVVALFERYLSLIETYGPFYRRPLNSTEGIKFSIQVVGFNTLGQYMKSMFSAANIDTSGRNISNHSGKVTCCSTLYNNGFADKSVKSRSGHRSNAVQLYQREDKKLLQDISNALQPPCPREHLALSESKENVSAEIRSAFKENTSVTPGVLRIEVPDSVGCVEIVKGGKKMKIEL